MDAAEAALDQVPALTALPPQRSGCGQEVVLLWLALPLVGGLLAGCARLRVTDATAADFATDIAWQDVRGAGPVRAVCSCRVCSLNDLLLVFLCQVGADVGLEEGQRQIAFAALWWETCLVGEGNLHMSKEAGLAVLMLAWEVDEVGLVGRVTTRHAATLSTGSRTSNICNIR